ncbi:2-oxo acid dehydrogenase subunit E2 [Puteibacter caeruleilacunae]|nr:2-oxo acid dehydrogenase subunit E2 [Puteibacter caeruleilacunae]
MSDFKIVMPKMGESVQEATITKWFVKEGDRIEEDDVLFEIATDKVDSEIPSPVDGVVKKIFFNVDDLVPVGKLVLLVDTEEENSSDEDNGTELDQLDNESITDDQVNVEDSSKTIAKKDFGSLSNRFYSPLVKSIAQREDISIDELEQVKGSGLNGRVQKKDLLDYLKNRKEPVEETVLIKEEKTKVSVSYSIGAEDTIMEMDRVRKMIAEHMVYSKKVAPHVTTMVEVDVTNLVLWRTKNKDAFQEKYGEKITYMPVFVEAVAKALIEYPLVNSSVDDDKVIIKKDKNIAIAVAKPDGNLVVPVIKQANMKNLTGLTSEMNRLAEGARENKLSPDEYQEGTFTITNFGTFRNLMGTPIINQPQVAVMATGSIEKKPAVMETPTGDAIVVRHKMFLSLSYDHRIVDGVLGGAFLRRVADILEEFNVDRVV